MLRKPPLTLAFSALLGSLPALADDVEHLQVTGSQIQKANTATGLPLSQRETPQSLTVMDQDLLQDFNLDTLVKVLEFTPGVTVEKVETDRTYFTSRGFEINNFQLDGLGAPFYSNVVNGDTDMSLFERVEVVRGAAGLMAGVGNPSATVNLVRKRPTAETQGQVTLSLGRWDNYQGELDLSGPLAEGLRGRFVASHSDNHSYIDDYSKTLSSVYGVLEADLGLDTLLTLGANYQEGKPKSPMWGALTLVYTDGSATHFDRSSNTSADWAYWNSYNTQAFAELKHQFGNGWNGKLVYEYRKSTQNSDLFYVYGTIEPQTNVGLTGYASRYDLDSKAQQLDASVTGQYRLLGRSHDLTFGASWVRNELTDLSLYDFTNGFPPIGDFTQWHGQAPYPNLVEGATGSDIDDTQKALYGATRLHLTDRLSLIGGGRLIRYKSAGDSYGANKGSEVKDKLVPYGGLVFDLSQSLSLYGSYSETFQAQAEQDIDQRRLGPTEGKSLEGGIKGDWFHGGLNASLAVFKNQYDNLAQSLGQNSQGRTYYQGFDYESKGVEAQLSGQLTDEVKVLLGYTQLKIEGQDGQEARRYIPKQSAKALVSYNPQALDALRLGASLRWQSKVFVDVVADSTPDGDLISRVTQGAYGIYGLFAQYQLNPRLRLALNLDNLTDKHYYSSLMWDQAFYGSPRSYNLSLSWDI